MSFRTFGEIISEAADVLLPPQRMTVAEAAEKHVYINQPGAYQGYYNNELAPYMREPMDTFTSRSHNGIVFVGSAQSGKTQALLLNTVAYSVLVNPMDMIIYCPTGAAARDFSNRRINRMHRNSEHSGIKSEMGKQLRSGRDSDNVFDKHYKSGMILSVSWPSPTEFAGRPIGWVMLTDRDRMDDDIEGDGEPFDLAMARTRTFGSYAMTVAESSPSRPLSDPNWVRRTPHEAPPCGGILSLYNRGDRRRFYWPCPHCGSYFEGNFRMLEYDARSNPIEAAATVRMVCPVNSCKIVPDERREMLRRGRWLKEGQGITSDGVIHGDGILTDIASFWLNGVAAAFQSWNSLVRGFIIAEESFERGGDEAALVKFYNNDLAEPYMPKAMQQLRLPEVLKGRAENIGGTQDEPTVPHEVRFLVATVDVQLNMFVVQVHGVSPGSPFDMTIVDRFNIRLSASREDQDGQRAWVKPGTYAEDWDLITEQVLRRTYPLADESGRRMQIKHVGCDSGGKAGVTSNAYTYYRGLAKEGLAARFQLIKGSPIPGAPRARIDYPDSSNVKMKAAAHGDIPVLMLNSNQVKDIANNRLDCVTPGKGLVRFPEWLPDAFYKELCVETRDEKGWQKPYHARNEAWDLLYYCIGLCISTHIQAETIDWNNAPGWAREWDKNSLVSKADGKARFALPGKSAYDFAELAKQLT